MSHQPYISILIPLYNEVESIPEMYAQVTAACVAIGRPYELVWIDDGSKDGSGKALDDLVARDAHVRVVHFRRNFGKSSALAAGFERVRGQIVLTLDADLQDDPAMIDDFVRRIEAGADLVSGWKRKRHDPLDKTLPSRLFNGVVSRLSGVKLHDFNCGFKAYRLDCVRELSVYGGFHRFLPVLAHHRGFRVEELVVNHRARVHGHSKYGVKRMFDGFMDLLTVLLVTRYRTRPLHFFGIPGAVLGAIGMMLLTYLSVLWILGYELHDRPLLTLGVLMTIVAMQFIGVGLLGELLVRTTIRSPEIFSIRAEQEASEPARAALYTVDAPQLAPSAMPAPGRELPVTTADELLEEPPAAQDQAFVASRPQQGPGPA
jgi:glycosyltransferase involved in cell wall biosynthesis